jgi:hypothetical protein
MNTVWHELRRFNRPGGRFNNWHTIRAQGFNPGILYKSAAPTAMSRIIEQQMIRAISNETDWRKDNTSFEIIHRGEYFNVSGGISSTSREIQVKLHGHKIASIFPGNKMILSSCGWETQTTKSRLNSILHHYNLGGIFQKDYVWYCDKGEFEDNMPVV